MRHLIITAILAFASLTHATTVQGLIDLLNAETNTVLSAWLEVAPVTMGQSPLYLGTIGWVEIKDGSVIKQSKDIIVKDLGVVVNEINTEQAYWVGGIPGPLKAESKFLTSWVLSGWSAKTKEQQFSDIKAFCNVVYKGVVQGAGDIREFSAEPVNGSIVKVSGYFNTGASLDQWQRMTWFARIINPDLNGLGEDNSNVEFHRVVDEGTAND